MGELTPPLPESLPVQSEEINEGKFIHVSEKSCNKRKFMKMT